MRSHSRRVLLVAAACAACGPVLAAAPALDSVALVQAAGVGVGGMVIIDHRGYLLFKDGSVSRSLAMAPGDIDSAAARDPKQWGRWRKADDGALEFNWSDGKTSRYKKWWRARPGARGARLQGNYRSIGGGGNTALGGATMIAAWSNIRFERDGTYSLAQGAGGSAPGVATSSNSADGGRYEIDGHRIVLTSGAGQRQAATFFLFPDSDSAIGIGNRVYSRRDK